MASTEEVIGAGRQDGILITLSHVPFVVNIAAGLSWLQFQC